LEKRVSFTGKIFGDGSCFCWDNVPIEDIARIGGGGDALYPDTVFRFLGVSLEKRYKFTISIEEIQEAP
jgi:hypothetical protein